MKTHEILNKAADLIEERGWVAGPEGMKPGGPHCALGALSEATGAQVFDVFGGIYNYVDEATEGARQALRSYLSRPGLTDVAIYTWNDKQESAAPVIEALRAAAVIEAAREDSESKVEVSA